MNKSAARRIYPFALILCLAIAFGCLAYPIYVIRPFRAQAPGELMAALAVTRLRPLITVFCALVALAGMAWYWISEPKMWRRIVAAVGALAVTGFTVLCRVNIYELMFHPIDRPAFSPVTRSKLDKGEMVIAVKAGFAARAYPIRGISYHHIVNDTLGGVPLVATY